jgi:hypothetical protein
MSWSKVDRLFAKRNLGLYYYEIPTGHMIVVAILNNMDEYPPFIFSSSVHMM